MWDICQLPVIIAGEKPPPFCAISPSPLPASFSAWWPGLERLSQIPPRLEGLGHKTDFASPAQGQCSALPRRKKKAGPWAALPGSLGNGKR